MNSFEQGKNSNQERKGQSIEDGFINSETRDKLSEMRERLENKEKASSSSDTSVVSESSDKENNTLSLEQQGKKKSHGSEGSLVTSSVKNEESADSVAFEKKEGETNLLNQSSQDKYASEESFDQNEKLIKVLDMRRENYEKRVKEMKKKYKQSVRKSTKKELKESISILEQRQQIIKKRTAEINKKKIELEEKNLGSWDRLKNKTGRNCDYLKRWGSKRENWSKLGKKVAIGAGISIGLGTIGLGAGVIAGVAGAAGGYLGQGVGSEVYEKYFRKDFRTNLVNIRKEALLDANFDKIHELEKNFYDAKKKQAGAQTDDKKNIFEYQAQQAAKELVNHLTDVREKRRQYAERLKSFDSREDFASTIKKQNRTKKAASILGGMLFGATGRMMASPFSGVSIGSEGDLDSPSQETETPSSQEVETPSSDFDSQEEGAITDTNKEDSYNSERATTTDTNATESSETKPSQETTKESLVLEDIFIHKNEGVTHALARQIEHSEALREHFQLGDSPTHKEVIRAAAKAARETGYISDTGEIRVLYGQGAGYELHINSDGDLEVAEHTGIGYDSDTKTYTYDGSPSEETHVQGEASGEFEGDAYEHNRENLVNTNSEDPSAASAVRVEPATAPGNATIEPTHHSEGFTGSRLDESHVRKTGFTGASLETHIPGTQSLGTEVLRDDYGIASPMSQSHLSERLGSRIIPQKLIGLFQNPKYPDLWMQIDSPQESSLIFEAMGLEEDKISGRGGEFRSVITGDPVTFKDIYERVNLAKLKEEVERLKQIRGI